MDKRKQAARGTSAKALLQNDILRDAFDAIEQEISDGWKNSVGAETENRENAYYMHRALQALKDKINYFINTGDIANKQLSEDTENK